MERQQYLEFGKYRLVPDRGFFRNDKLIPFPPKVGAILELLVRAEGRIVSKEDIIAAVWGPSAASEDSLFGAISTLRRALPKEDGQEIVQSVHGRGYRIGVTVRRVKPAESGAEAPQKAEGVADSAGLRVLGDLADLRSLTSSDEFHREIAHEITRCRNHGQTSSLLMIHLDGFMEMQRHAGGKAADRALKLFEDCARRALRKMDIVARLDIADFSAILSGADAEATFAVAERLRHAVQDASSGDDTPLTLSIGLTVFGGDDTSPEQPQNRAGKALGQAVAAGANCVRSWLPGD